MEANLIPQTWPRSCLHRWEIAPTHEGSPSTVTPSIAHRLTNQAEPTPTGREAGCWRRLQRLVGHVYYEKISGKAGLKSLLCLWSSSPKPISIKYSFPGRTRRRPAFATALSSKEILSACGLEISTRVTSRNPAACLSYSGLTAGCKSGLPSEHKIKQHRFGKHSDIHRNIDAQWLRQICRAIFPRAKGGMASR